LGAACGYSIGCVRCRGGVSMTTCGRWWPSVRAARWCGGTRSFCSSAAITRFTRRRARHRRRGRRGRSKGPSARQDGILPARRFSALPELDLVYATQRDHVANQRRHAADRFVVAEQLAEERQTLRFLAPAAFDCSLNRTARVLAAGYLRHAGCLFRGPVELVHQRLDLHASRDEGVNKAGVENAWPDTGGPIAPGGGCPSRACAPSRHRRLLDSRRVRW
jgi:hypothetical protein